MLLIKEIHTVDFILKKKKVFQSVLGLVTNACVNNHNRKNNIKIFDPCLMLIP